MDKKIQTRTRCVVVEAARVSDRHGGGGARAGKTVKQR